MEFNGIPKEGFQFLLDLRFNNNREWFNEHKATYLNSLRDPLYALAAGLAPAALAVDSEMETRPERVVSRIYRDARRLRGQAFYRDVVWFSFKRPAVDSDGRSFSIYFYMNPEEYGWGCGFYEQNTGHMEALRKRIAQEPETFLKIVTADGLQPYVLNGPAYRKPKGVFEEEVLNLWYNKKTFSLDYDLPVDEGAYSPQLLTKLSTAMADMKNLYRFVMGMEPDFGE